MVSLHLPDRWVGFVDLHMGGSIPTRRSVVLTARGTCQPGKVFGTCVPNTMSATILVAPASDKLSGYLQKFNWLYMLLK
jgi:hypothetical protein